MTYTLLRNTAGDVTGLQRDDGAVVPLDARNADFQTFLAVHGPLPACAPRDWIQDADGHIREMTAEEKAARDAALQQAALAARWAALRAERNARLAACDWTQLPDAPLTAEQQAEWQVYRQALRDLPQTTTDPYQVEWPTPPGDM